MAEPNLEKIGDVLDRHHEAHFWLHMLEEYYHLADPFRWHLNAFLKTIKEVQALIPMCLQNEPGFSSWYETHKAALKQHPLLATLASARDYVVHRGSLVLRSSGSIGITEGRGLKLGLTWPIDPKQDSDEAMSRFVFGLAHASDFLGFLQYDEDSLPCVERIWRLPNFDDEIIELCATAWLRLGETISEVVQWLGSEKPVIELNCRHSSQEVRFKLYKRNPLRAQLRHYRAQEGFVRASPKKDSFRDWADRGESDIEE